jgi:hypothetical protein
MPAGRSLSARMIGGTMSAISLRPATRFEMELEDRRPASAFPHLRHRGFARRRLPDQTDPARPPALGIDLPTGVKSGIDARAALGRARTFLRSRVSIRLASLVVRSGGRRFMSQRIRRAPSTSCMTRGAHEQEA